MECLRILIDPPAAGAWNMAVDEALLETAADTGQATLRFYEWETPTLSLGYFQSLARRQLHAASRDCPVVRRASGGGAILHDRELTYSIAIPQPAGRTFVAGRLYDISNETLIATLAELGVLAGLYRGSPHCQSDAPLPDEQPFLCFQRRTCSDIVLKDAKIVGSAQRRRRGAVLQHGSILLARSRFAPEVPGIRELTKITIQPRELIDRWPPGLAGCLGLSLNPGRLHTGEVERSAALARGRFASVEHLQRR